jgi:hypothetical protein
MVSTLQGRDSEVPPAALPFFERTIFRISCKLLDLFLRYCGVVLDYLNSCPSFLKKQVKGKAIPATGREGP